MPSPTRCAKNCTGTNKDMGAIITRTGRYRFAGYDSPVHVCVRMNARSIRARWKSGAVEVTAPTGIEYERLQEALSSFLPRLQQSKPRSYAHGDVIAFEDFSVSIRAQSHAPASAFASFSDGKGVIEVGTDIDMEAAPATKMINKIIGDMAKRLAPSILLPLAAQVAREVGRAPAAWKISKGHRVLGHCSAAGEVALSHALLFYPTHLRRYVICHELAHLTEMNHSPRFHAICNLYCGGREAELEAMLRAYRPPLCSFI